MTIAALLNYYNSKYFLCKTDTESHNHSSLGTENKNVLDINSSSHNIKPSQNKSYPECNITIIIDIKFFNTTQVIMMLLVLFIYQ